MLRGEFIRGDGEILPNNVTSRGAQRILSRAFSNLDGANVVDPANDPVNFIALGSGVYTPLVSFADLHEPTLGVGGYARISIPRGNTGWAQAQLNGEWYVESIPFTFTPTAPYSVPVSRLILTAAQTDGLPWAVSSPFSSLTPGPTTDPLLLTFKYRLYLR